MKGKSIRKKSQIIPLFKERPKTPLRRPPRLKGKVQRLGIKPKKK